jgi:hypothetical protein
VLQGVNLGAQQVGREDGGGVAHSHLRLARELRQLTQELLAKGRGDDQSRAGGHMRDGTTW